MTPLMNNDSMVLLLRAAVSGTGGYLTPLLQCPGDEFASKLVRRRAECGDHIRRRTSLHRRLRLKAATGQDAATRGIDQPGIEADHRNGTIAIVMMQGSQHAAQLQRRLQAVATGTQSADTTVAPEGIEQPVAPQHRRGRCPAGAWVRLKAAVL